MASHARLLWVAYEPWETKIGVRILEQVSATGLFSSSTLLIADPYQPTNTQSARLLSEVKNRSEFDCDLTFEDNDSWQLKIRAATMDSARENIAVLEQRLGLGGLESLADTDVVLNPLERSPYYPPMSVAQRLMASWLVLDKTLSLVEQKKPTLIAMLDDQYLVKNFLGLIAPTMGIELRILRPARYRRFVKCDSFFLPTSNIEIETKKTTVSSPNSEPLFDDSLYESNQSPAGKRNLNVAKQNRLKSTALIFGFGFMNQLTRATALNHVLRVLANKSPRSIGFLKSRYWEISGWRNHIFLLLQSLRYLRYIWSKFPFEDLSKISLPYVLVPLHVRPESSILTMGGGISEENLLRRVSEIIRKRNLSFRVVALEHPEMIQDRRLAFYRNLIRSSGVMFADPRMSTKSAIEKSLAVLTVSGTAALEASLLGIPVHVVGLPDYLPAIRSQGFQNLESFLESVENSSAPISQEDVIDYLRTIEIEGIEMSWSWEAVSSEANSEETSSKAFELLAKSLQPRVTVET